MTKLSVLASQFGLTLASARRAWTRYSAYCQGVATYGMVEKALTAGEMELFDYLIGYGPYAA